MFKWAKQRLYNFLRWSEKYTKTDMVYFAHGNFWLTAGRIFSISIGMLLTIGFANLLSATDFGIYKYILAIAGVVGAFTLGGLGNGITRAIALGHQNVVPGVARVSFLWSLPAALVAIAIGAYYFINGNTTLAIGLFLIGVTTPLFNSLGFSKNILLGKKDFKNLTLYGIPRGLVPIISILLALFITRSVVIILITYFLSNLITAWVMDRVVMKKYQIKDEPEHVSETVRYGKHMSVIGVTSQLVGNLDQLLLWHFAGPVQLAIYSFALAPIREIRNFPENISPLLFPKYATKTVTEMKQTAPLRIKQLFIASILIAGAYIVVAPFLYKFLFPQYVSAIFASQLLAAALILQPRNIVDTMLLAQGNVRLRYISVFATQGAKIVLWIALIPPFGFMGAVIGTVFTDLVSSLALWWVYKRLRDEKPMIQ